MKKKMSLENRITLAQNNALDFTHACMTIALHEVFGLGRERLQQLAQALDGGILIAEDGAEVELYGNGGRA